MAVSSGARVLGAALIVGAVSAATPAAAADYSFTAKYRVALSGLELGSATISGKFDGGEYRIDGRGKLTGIAGALVQYKGSASAAGRHGGAGGAAPTAFSVDATDGEKTTKVRMTMNGNSVGAITLEPPLPKKPHPKRVGVNEGHKRGVIDPMSALLVFGAVEGGEVSRSVCQRTLPVFNGRERFDIALSFKELRTVKEGFYSGPAVVCEARYQPIAGHRSDRDEIEYFASRTAEVVYIPVNGADLAIPYRVTLPTPLGNGTLGIVGLETSGTLGRQAAVRRP